MVIGRPGVGRGISRCKDPYAALRRVAGPAQVVPAALSGLFRAVLRRVRCGRVANGRARGRRRRSAPLPQVERQAGLEGGPPGRCVPLDRGPRLRWRAMPDGALHVGERALVRDQPPAAAGDCRGAGSADREPPQRVRSAEAQGALRAEGGCRPLGDRADGLPGCRPRRRPGRRPRWRSCRLLRSGARRTGPPLRIGRKKAAAILADAPVPGGGRVESAAAGAPHDGSWRVHASYVPDRRAEILCEPVRGRRTRAHRVGVTRTLRGGRSAFPPPL